MGTIWSIRSKIGALVASVAVLLSAMDVLLIPARVARAEQEELYERAQVLAKVLAEPMGLAMDLEQQADAFTDVLRTSLNEKLVRWVALYDADGKRLTTLGESSAAETRQALEHRTQDDTIVASVEVRSRNRSAALGTVAVALHAERINERRAASQSAMALQAVFILGLGVVMAILISNPMAKSLRAIRIAAVQIARGDVSGNVELPTTKDELGDLAKEFREMNSRLRVLQESAVRVAGGDLTGTITGDGELFAAFRDMVGKLRQLAGRIGQSSSSVATAAAGMFSSVRQQGASATQQNSALEEIRRTVETLADSAEQVAEDASKVREIAHRSLASTQRTAEQTRLVSTHSDRIGEILSLIQNIADKSDLLALNAALEGTKAGEVGRGFSLVAAEMRRLSEHVMDSVRDIRKLVADMHGASHASVLATEEGIKLAQETAAAAEKISVAVARQREGTTHVKTAVIDIVTAVNDSLSSSDETTRNAESLLQLSHELKVAAKHFRIGARDGLQDADESE